MPTLNKSIPARRAALVKHRDRGLGSLDERRTPSRRCGAVLDLAAGLVADNRAVSGDEHGRAIRDGLARTIPGQQPRAAASGVSRARAGRIDVPVDDRTPATRGRIDRDQLQLQADLLERARTAGANNSRHRRAESGGRADPWTHRVPHSERAASSSAYPPASSVSHDVRRSPAEPRICARRVPRVLVADLGADRLAGGDRRSAQARNVRPAGPHVATRCISMRPAASSKNARCANAAGSKVAPSSSFRTTQHVPIECRPSRPADRCMPPR